MAMAAEGSSPTEGPMAMAAEGPSEGAEPVGEHGSMGPAEVAAEV